uniref:Probable capsid and replication-associated protein n=1 Tax=Torque teno virus (isolate Human/Ghana/GH1/1996) TaxID=487067 RepID=CAPSD_TTVVG|nr:RecName: Full=Probable capsid and replication-associated protein [Torque teno virus Human/Ghana/GH1/1996]AAD24198.1 unknown [Torque teno virus]
MAYGWWRRRRRRWRRWRRRPWRRRWRTRRRRPARRRGRRRNVRRRRRGGRWRRRYRRWKRKGRRRKKAKIIIRQWQPNYRRRCNIVGYIPVLICGENTVSRNYATHSDDTNYPGPFGGGMTTDKFTLRILYGEYKRFMNYWTASNEDLDLCRYLGVNLYFFRHPDVDFIIKINTMPPFLDTELTAPSIHPGMLALDKRARWIPSLKSRPGKKHYIKIRVGAPKMFTDKWYPQTDLCDMVLLTVYATAADMQYPFGSPLTDSVVVNFQVLQSMYDEKISILPDEKIQRQNLLTSISNYIPFYNTTQTIAQLKPFVDAGNAISGTTTTTWGSLLNTTKFTTTTTTTYTYPGTTNTTVTFITANDSWYRGTVYNQNIKDVAKKAAELYSKATKAVLGNTFTTEDYTLGYHGGLYSSIWLSPGRSYFETPGAYTDIKYNPFTDRGEGNMLWIDWLSKKNMNYDKVQSKCLISDLPLWAAAYGYVEFCAKSTGDQNIHMNARLLIRSPFTDPQLLVHTDPTKGFVPYSLNFGNGKMPGGSSNVPIRMRAKWYPTLLHQQEVLEALAQSGPFAYHADIKKVSLGMKYRFKWIWGGNPVRQQVVRNPCKETHSSGNRVPRSLQIVDPKYNSPELTFHTWDFKRGLFGPKAIQRMQQQPTTTDIFSAGRKRPRRDTEVYHSSQEGEQKESLLFPPVKLLRRVPPWEDSQQEESGSQSSEEETQTVSQQLKQQLQQQRILGVKLRLLFNQVQKIQQNQDINPTLLPRGGDLASLFQIAP